jgi:hypothetical protein
MSCERLKNMQIELRSLINNKNATKDQYESFYKNNGILYTNVVQEEIKNTCDKITAQGSSNFLRIDPECVKNTEELCMAIHKVPREVVDGDPRLLPWYYRECYDKYGPEAKYNIQTNFSAIKSDCTVNTILNDPKLNNDKEMAIVVAMILADQEIRCKPDEKNSYFHDFGTKEKILSINKCLNAALTKQQNYMSGCRFSNKRQENISDLVNNCIIKTTIGAPTGEIINIPSFEPPNLTLPDISPIFTNPASSYTTTPSNNTTPRYTTPVTINTTTPAPKDTTMNMVIVVVIILAAIFIGYFFF